MVATLRCPYKATFIECYVLGMECWQQLGVSMSRGVATLIGVSIC